MKTLFLTLICQNTAPAYYDPRLQRWLTRDPIAQAGVSDALNVYEFVNNEPLYSVDARGLTVWKCARTTDIDAGRHAYLWDDRPGPRIHSCGQGGIWGQGPTSHRKDKGPIIIAPALPPTGGPLFPPVKLPPWQSGDYTCIALPNTDGKEDQIMSRCRKCINRRWTYALLTNDCHSACDDVLEDLGYDSPPMSRF